ncbi:hypothetical protein Sango_0078000 [Sesamum angolense]|uniref:Uncharacterized protein n=1 Tax=Sesamum angolense TaxID=2727404 RepID=A0AAE1XDX5_9LAMI|nr:hypothetical protein Sango_0078000 [Sesamum angolense]
MSNVVNKAMNLSIIVVLFLMLSPVFFVTEARRLNAAPKLHGFSVNAIKAGPSPGDGHKYVNAHTLGGVKESGPSPGDGHKYVNAKTLGGIKESGPSPGDGHKYTNAKTLGGIKDSGPSPGAGH